MKGVVNKILQGGMAFTVALAAGAQGAPGTISNSPLIVRSSTTPNLMFLLDSSGSMNNIVPDAPYDEGVTYGATCPAGITIVASDGDLSTRDGVLLKVLSSGEAYFRTGDDYTGLVDDYDWGVEEGKTGITARDQWCFDASGEYEAELYADDGLSGFTKTASGDYLPAVYSGNYLNWYFSDVTHTTGDEFPSDARLKSDTQTRMEVAQSAATTVIGSFENVRLGLATFNDDEGALIRQGLEEISDAKVASINAEIESIEASGGTPLAESLEQIGRYFIEGYEGEQLSYTDHKTKTTKLKIASDVFSTKPAYADSGDEPTKATAVIEEFCQPNFLIALTDGQPQDDQDVDDDLQDFDGDCALNPANCVATDPNYDKKTLAGYSYASEGSDYLDDVAQALNEIDLRPDLDDFDNNQVINNITTYFVAFDDDADIDNQLLEDAAAQGGGQLFTAKNAAALTDAFETATTEVFGQVGSAASVAFNSTSLGTDSAVFFARFNTNRWSGELFAFPLSGTGVVEAQAWEASEKLDTSSVTPSSRTFFTYDGTDGVNFQWADVSSLTAIANDLNFNTDTNVADGNGEKRLDYLRGDRSNEGSGIDLRIRNSRLGDIVDSTPVYVGAPGLSYPDEAPFGTASNRYSVFKAAAENRTPVLYVGANDGVLHGFNGDVSGAGGGELFAYVPAELFSAEQTKGLHYLASTDYAHRFYVNASPTISDAFIKRETVGGAKADWRTVLIGGTGAGGKGIFALDVSDPTEFSESVSTNAPNVVLWEFTSDDDADLGATYSKPVVAMMNNGEWAVIFGNGYNNTGDYTAKVFVLFIEEGLDGTWSAGDYLELETGIGTNADINGMSSLAVADVDGDQVLDRIYGGDLYGNIWVFDVSSNRSNDWESAYIDSTTPKPLFTAADPGGDTSIRQPITAGPALVRNTSTHDEGEDIVVLFGTGQYLTGSDPSNTAEQSFYGVWDHGSQELGRTDLVSRTLSETSGLRKIASTIANEEDIDWSTKHGWYVDFNVTGRTGERVISNAQVRGAAMFFNTIIPSSIVCAAGGSGFLMSLDPQTGLAPDFGVFDGDNDGDIDNDDSVYVGQYLDGLPAQSGILGNKQYTPTSKGTLEERDIETAGSDRLGRLAWEELVKGL